MFTTATSESESFQSKLYHHKNTSTSGWQMINDLQNQSNNNIGRRSSSSEFSQKLLVLTSTWTGRSESFCQLMLSKPINRECKQRQRAVSLWDFERRKQRSILLHLRQRKTRKKRNRERIDDSLSVAHSGNFVNGLASQSRNVSKQCWCVWMFDCCLRDF